MAKLVIILLLAGPLTHSAFARLTAKELSRLSESGLLGYLSRTENTDVMIDVGLELKARAAVWEATPEDQRSPFGPFSEATINQLKKMYRKYQIPYLDANDPINRARYLDRIRGIIVLAEIVTVIDEPTRNMIRQDFHDRVGKPFSEVPEAFNLKHAFGEVEQHRCLVERRTVEAVARYQAQTVREYSRLCRRGTQWRPVHQPDFASSR